MADTVVIRLPDAPTPAQCQLVVVDGKDMGRAVPVGTGSLVVGSGEGADLRLTDAKVSERHLELRAARDGFNVTDLHSTNGTWFEGSRIESARVPVGATLRVGETHLRFVARPEPLELPPSRARRLGDLVAESLGMREVFALLEHAARSDVTVLVQGETGTGKELVARALHEASGLRSGPFVAVDCGALPESLLESELFGHVKGAFTGADRPRDGAFVRAHRGTLFLDELGAIPPAVQSRLLRVVEERQVRPVGGDEERAVDVRLIAASGTPLEDRVRDGAFRPDLYYRLAVLSVTLPPLRARREDIGPIISELLRRRGLEPAPVAGEALARLEAHAWPGNVRELRNVIDRALALSPGARTFAELRIQLVPGGDTGLPVRTDLPFKDAKDAVVVAFEREYLRTLNERHQGNVSAAAREAQVDRKHWRGLLRRYGLSDPDSGGDD